MTFFLRFLTQIAIGLVALSANAWVDCAEKVAGLPQGPAAAVDLENGIAAVGQGLELRLVSLADPEAPELLGDVALPGVIAAVDLSDGYILAAAGTSGLQVVDVSQPYAPVVVGELIGEPALAVDVKRRGNYAYLLENVPSILGSLPMTRSATVTVKGTRAYVGQHSCPWAVPECAPSLRIVDVSDPAAPREHGMFRGLFPQDRAVQGTMVYLAFWGALWVIDCSNPASPELIASHDVAYSTESFVLTGHLAFVATGPCPRGACRGGLSVLDTTVPGQPSVIARFVSPGEALNVAVVDELAWLADGDAGLAMVDIASCGVHTPRRSGGRQASP